MRNWKIGLAATVAIAVVATGVVVYKNNMFVGGTAGAAPNPGMMAMPVREKDDSDHARLCGAHGVYP